jgi:hypothetical protein
MGFSISDDAEFEKMVRSDWRLNYKLLNRRNYWKKNAKNRPKTAKNGQKSVKIGLKTVKNSQNSVKNGLNRL